MNDKAIEAAHNIFFGMIDTGKSSMDCMRAAIAAYEQAMWRPIEEAKKDGSTFLALNSRATMVGYRVVYFDDEAEEPYIWHVDDAGKGFNHHRDFFTHYRLLPPPPVTP